MLKSTGVMIRSGTDAIKTYYKHRAFEYDDIYKLRRRQADLAWLRRWVTRHVKGKTVLEVAAGTGYWTQVCSRSARQVVATDYNANTLTVAAGRRLGSQVSFVTADAFRLPAFETRFEVGMAVLWWSHLKQREQEKFIAQFLSRLAPGAKLLLVDEVYRRGTAKNPISRLDRFGDRYEIRVGKDDVLYEIVKNYPADDDLKRALSDHCDQVRITRLRHFWAISARVKVRQ
ncbi:MULTISPECIES: bifunctional 2-polyprenyl-6-hydroxyphenol methylase/3-demethylubiquinol 3-O-methyltransferase UbiG [unclassified Bradyrhizobium]|uniref:class I SAM-dependent methyltransferase n=1 Tax=unclassified Bradyrhizobium TaxID=2631580 RepID=UPI000489990E|nr:MULTISPECIES: class I SAM-dependent methyltransferase [unclassified Bradyrhizobium]MCP3466070.1 class I SAM-dependent methyltransferase [Bradyrhizobium sp. CCGUVB23]